MYNGIALYGTESIAPSLAIEIGISFFNLLNINISSAGYSKYLENGDHEGDHETIIIPLSMLKNKIKKGEKLSFRIYSENKNNVPWLASFGYSTNEFGGFHHIDMQCPIQDKKNILGFIRDFLSKIDFSYGIVYTFDEITNAYFYSSGGNLLTKFTNESPSAFKKETLRCLRGSESYKGSMLRMVYPINILNRKHLQLNVFGESLDKWILSNEFNGKLEKINDKLWVWIVDEDHMDDLNNYCGKAGILISWKPQIKKTAPKLP